MLLFLDGMAHYDTARIGMKYSTVDNHFADWSIVSEGRVGNCLKRVSTSNAQTPPLAYVSIAPLTTRLGTWTPTASGVCGFAIKVDDLSRVANFDAGSQGTAGDLFVVMEGSFPHVKVQLNQSGTFTLRGYNGIGSSDILLAQSVEGLTSGTWMYVEFKWLIDASAGMFEIRVNGITVLTFTGNTREQGSESSLGIWNSVRLFCVSSEVVNPPTYPPLVMRMCDLYLADLAAPLTDDVYDFLGDGTIVAIYPDGPGSSTGWTPSSGTANWDLTNEKPAPDDDGTYVVTATLGAKDVYAFEDLPAGAIVKGAHLVAMARKEDVVGSAALAPIVHQGATDYEGPTQGVSNILYDRYLTQPYDLNPATNAKFTAAEINAGEFGLVRR